MNAREDIHPGATRLAVMESWRVTQTTHVPLVLAASFALFELRAAESLEAPESSFDYLVNLNVVAAALSSLIPLYTQKSDLSDPVAVTFDPTCQRFEGGATVLRGTDGTFIANLLVSRADVVGAMPAIERARSFFLLPIGAKRSGQKR